MHRTRPEFTDRPILPTRSRPSVTRSRLGLLMTNHRIRRLHRLDARPLTYPEVGATAGVLPEGYRHLRRNYVIGRGAQCFLSASTTLMSWHMHEAAGVKVTFDQPKINAGSNVVLSFGWGPIKIAAPCRILRVFSEPDRRGFTYGTLRGHPESGEEEFLIRSEPDETVTFTITAFSRPARSYLKVLSPISHRVQRNITERYARAVLDLAKRT